MTYVLHRVTHEHVPARKRTVPCVRAPYGALFYAKLDFPEHWTRRVDYSAPGYHQYLKPLFDLVMEPPARDVDAHLKRVAICLGNRGVDEVVSGRMTAAQAFYCTSTPVEMWRGIVARMRSKSGWDGSSVASLREVFGEPDYSRIEWVGP